MAFSHWVNDRY